MQESTVIQRALLTVYDKTGLLPLAEYLHGHGVELISTGNTAKLLQQHGLPVVPVEQYTGFPEMMGGRVKTLHPKIHGGILGRRDIDIDEMIQQNIPDIDLVVVNLYPFQSVIQQPTCTLADAIENIDIGGPTLLRGSAKNHAWCTVLVDPNDYHEFIRVFEKNNGAIDANTRFRLAAKAFAHTAQYEASIAQYFNKVLNQDSSSPFANLFSRPLTLKQSLRYGENPHQASEFYHFGDPAPDGIASTKQLQGKELSYNNINDGDTALECVKQFVEPCCVIVKHSNPCGVALGDSLLQAYDKAYACDPTSAFGGILAFNQPVDSALMALILERQFVEVMIAPQFSEGALKVAQTKPNCRLLQYQPSTQQNPRVDVRSVNGGLLIQEYDALESTDNYHVVTQSKPTPKQMQDLIFGYKVARFVKSNAIVYAKDNQTLAIGAGQMSRIFCTEIAALKAQSLNLSLHGAVMASDAFFPFPDNVEKAHQYGITAIIQPGGSIKDNAVIDCANQFNMAMVFTHTRHFRH